jgi:hypothetical protein
MNNELFCFFCTILTSALFAISHAGTVKYAADNMISNARQIPDPASADYNRAVLLEVVVYVRKAEFGFLGV